MGNKLDLSIYLGQWVDAQFCEPCLEFKILTCHIQQRWQMLLKFHFVTHVSEPIFCSGYKVIWKSSLGWDNRTDKAHLVKSWAASERSFKWMNNLQAQVFKEYTNTMNSKKLPCEQQFVLLSWLTSDTTKSPNDNFVILYTHIHTCMTHIWNFSHKSKFLHRVCLYFAYDSHCNSLIMNATM